MLSQRQGEPRAPRPSQRSDALADRLALHIETFVPRGRAQCLDIGYGDMTLAEQIHARVARTEWRCIDVRRPPAGVDSDGPRVDYRLFHGHKIAYADREFDVAVLCDVLCRTPRHAGPLLAEAARVAERVLVKDRFDEGLRSRTGFVTRETLVQLAARQNLVITALDADLYGASAALRAQPSADSEFIAVLRAA